MRAHGFGLLAAFTLGVTALAETPATAQSPPTSLQRLPGGSDYLAAPVWAHEPTAQDLWKYRPERAYRDGVPGGAVVDCMAQADGRLADCKTIEVRPAHWDYEFAGQLIVTRLYRLQPRTADGQPVAGKHVLVTVIWK